METTKSRGISIITSRVVKTEKGYGLFIYVSGNENKLYPDLTVNYERICAFSDAINRSEVSSLHLDELLEDFLE